MRLNWSKVEISISAFFARVTSFKNVFIVVLPAEFGHTGSEEHLPISRGDNGKQGGKSEEVLRLFFHLESAQLVYTIELCTCWGSLKEINSRFL